MTSRSRSSERSGPFAGLSRAAAVGDTTAREGTPEGDPLAEAVGNLIGRSVYAARHYREVPEPGEGRTVDVCGGCDVDCCSRYSIPLKFDDAALLRGALGLPLTAFATLIPYPRMASTYPVRIGDRQQMLALRRRRGGCLFLLRLGGLRRCGVHGLRPMACRLFPFLPDRDAQARAPEGMMAQRPPRDCPWRWPVTAEAEEQLAQRLDEDQAQRVRDQEVLRIWHRQMNLPHTRANFFRFLDEEVERRAAGGDGPGPWLTQLW